MVSDMKIFSQNDFLKIATAKKSFHRFFSSLLFTMFKCLFSPTSQSPMSQLVRFWNPWGKRMERSENLSHKECKFAACKKVIFIVANFALLAGFFWYHVSHIM